MKRTTDAFVRNLLGIDQVDAVMCEDGAIMLYGHTSNPDVTHVATIPPATIQWRRADLTREDC